MANKTQATRQKLVFRLDAKLSKPRNPLALSAKRSGAGSHRKSIASLRQALQRTLKKTPIKGEPD